jgi:integrase
LDVRDRAILLLLAVYGLRSIEVRKLKLMTWIGKGTSFYSSHQGRRTEPHPLSPTVGEAIARYLEQVRPRAPHREVFLTATAPIRLWAMARWPGDLQTGAPAEASCSAARSACTSARVRYSPAGARVLIEGNQ